MKKQTSDMRYQVESFNGIHRTNLTTLSSAKFFAEALVQNKVFGVQIARFDKSGNYYEIIKKY